jgi:hypothetical protein
MLGTGIEVLYCTVLLIVLRYDTLWYWYGVLYTIIERIDLSTWHMCPSYSINTFGDARHHYGTIVRKAETEDVYISILSA